MSRPTCECAECPCDVALDPTMAEEEGAGVCILCATGDHDTTPDAEPSDQ